MADAVAIMFYVGGVYHLVKRGRTFWQCLIWPFTAAREICLMLDDVKNKRLNPKEPK